MFKNVGQIIKSLAIVLGIGMAILSLVIGVVTMSNLSSISYASDKVVIVYSLLTIFFGWTCALISSVLLYGYGEIINKFCEIERNTRKPSNQAMNEEETPYYPFND